MRRLCIYVHRSGKRALHESGFSWVAAAALPIWALSKRLYKTAAAALSAQFILIAFVSPLLDRITDPETKGMVALIYVSIYWIVQGFAASHWHRYVLERAGFVAGAVEAALGSGSK